MAARIMDNGERKGKRVPHQSAAYYAIQHCKSGRRAVGHSNVDVHGSSTQLNGRSRLESMEEVVASDEETGGEIYLLHDVLSTDTDDPAMSVARKLDWQAFVADLPAREKAVVECLIEGASGSAIARKLRTRSWCLRSRFSASRALAPPVPKSIIRRLKRWTNKMMSDLMRRHFASPELGGKWHS